MADAALLNIVADRLTAEPPADGSGELVLAAFGGNDAVRDALRDRAALVVQPRPAVAAAAAPPAVFLSSIKVEGFRGIGEPATLAIDPGPGLTLVVGRNGSGKSSFSEGLEMLLTGTNQRWVGRNKVWQDGWQNLHHRRTHITARFDVDGRTKPLTISREWPGDELAGSALRIDGKHAPSLDPLAWTAPLSNFPPLLSHNELERALDEKQTVVYDALAGILGLAELAEAQRTLRAMRLELEDGGKRAKSGAATLIQLLEHTDDERAIIVRTALRRRTPDVDIIQAAVTGAAAVDEHGALRRLQELESLQVLDRDALYAAIDDLRVTAAEVERVRGTDASQADEIAKLLEQALAVHDHLGDQTCPVCSTENVLTFEWRMRAGARIGELREAASEVTTAKRRASDASARARRLITAVPMTLRDADGTGVDVGEALTAWERWLTAPGGDDHTQLANHLQATGPALIAAVASVRAAAAREKERRERSWRPAAEAILTWLPLALLAREQEESLRRVKAAESWLRDAHDALRDERFRPIAGAVQQNWTELRQDSNVSLGELELTGTGNTRRLKLDVRVDGEAGSALGVMSQGELNCLALSLFLPRASLPESPFHFVVIDDPVQAMDPAKVEGLARVLERAARERQVIVLTHDTRLADAVDYLGIRATRIEVVRREGSVVELRRVHDAVRRYLDDARAVAYSDGLPPEATRVIPGFCRLALEAACALAVTRRMLHEGRRYAEVQEALAAPTTLNMWLALAFFADAGRGGDVNEYLQRRHPLAVDLVKDCNRGAHGARVMRDPRGFVKGIEKLATAIAPPVSGDG